MDFDRQKKTNLSLALGLSLVSSYSISLPAIADPKTPDAASVAPTNTAAATTTNTAATSKLAIRNIYLNENKQIVVEFENPTHIAPATPQVRDYPGQQHDIVLEFPQTSFAIDKTPKARAVLAELMKVFPDLNSITYATANDNTKARIRIGVTPSVIAHPALVKVSEDAAIITLDLPEGSKSSSTDNTITSNNTAANNIAPLESKDNIPRQQNGEKVASANAPARTESSKAGMTTKTVNGIKGAWQSSLKAGQNQVSKLNKIAKLNPLAGKFGHGKQASQLSVPANAGIASVTTQDKVAVAPETKQIVEPTAAAEPNTSTQPTAAVEGMPSGQTTAITAESATTSLASTALEPAAPAKLATTAAPVIPAQPVATTEPAATAQATVTPTQPVATTEPAATAQTAVTPAQPGAIVPTQPSATIEPAVAAQAAVTPAQPGTTVLPATAVESLAAPATSETSNKQLSIAASPIGTSIPAQAAIAPLSSLKTEISSAQQETPAKNDQAVSGTTVTEKSALPVIDKSKTELPRISVASDIADKVSDEPLVTPLSVEQVLKEKASMEAMNPKPALSPSPENNLNQPIAAKETAGDASAISDFKTSFSKSVPSPAKETISSVEEKAKSESASKSTEEPKEESKEEPKLESLVPVTEETKKEGKKEETEKIAAVPNALDSLTKAVLSNSTASEAPEENTAPGSVELKSQKARKSGKDYLPVKFSDEAVEHYNNAVRFHLTGKLPEAIVEYKSAIDADPKIGEAYSNLGLIFNQQHKYDQAMAEFHQALAINPKDAITYNGIGAAMRAKNNMVAAVKNWKTAIVLDPNLASAHYNLGTAYELEKDLEKALAEYKEAVRHDDKLGEAYYRMGLILQKMNNKHLALDQYKQAVKISQQATYAQDAKRRINLLSQTKNQSM